LLRES